MLTQASWSGWQQSGRAFNSWKIAVYIETDMEDFAKLQRRFIVSLEFYERYPNIAVDVPNEYKSGIPVGLARIK